MEGPKTDVKLGDRRVHLRNVSNGVDGWLTVGAAGISVWAPEYKCWMATALHVGSDVETASVVRQLEVNAKVKAFGIQSKVGETGAFRVRAIGSKNDAVGFATVRDLLQLCCFWQWYNHCTSTSLPRWHCSHSPR